MTVASIPPMTRKSNAKKNIENAEALVIDGGHPLVQDLQPWPVRDYLRGLNSHTSDDIARLPKIFD